MSTDAHKFLPSRTGASFGAVVTRESDGRLTILSNDGAGYRSAHRDYARADYGRPVRNVSRLHWINLAGVRMACTQWEATTD